ncbi:sporozoite surface protein 3, putative [Plasmodium relictum]|uniref:Sporozoite surface protein 3, putative n=1 Tax=Plasmodium relictum TaxID=85471 RepID=A0A1J1HAM2_PLARL|nr:sporozoite surface protein 3, putative [Plasmodium relictum]CRH02521.1 sporozoite surface protein 3, putative [Plasmodium relictum]
MYILFFIFLFYFFFFSLVENFGYVCDFTSKKYNLDFIDNEKDDVICSHEIGPNDTIGVIIPQYKKGYENFHVITKCFNEVSLKESGDDTKSIYDVFKKDEIELSEKQITFSTEHNTSILSIKKVEKSTIIYCVFENSNNNKLITRRGIAKFSISKHSNLENEIDNILVVDLFNKLVPNVNIGNNLYHIKASPGNVLYILGTQLSNKKYIYFHKDNCPINFESIGDTYKFIFPIINEREIKYICSMYYEENDEKIFIGVLIITFEQKKPSLEEIQKDIIKKHMDDDVEKHVNKLLNDVEYDTIDNAQFIEQSINMNDEKYSILQSDYPDRNACNNDKCKDFFDNSTCSSKCGHGYRLLNGYELNSTSHIAVPCNNGECTIEDEIEPLVIFVYASMVFFCIIITIFTIMIYFLITNRKKIYSDPFVPYDSNLNNL